MTKTLYIQSDTTGKYVFQEPPDSFDQPHLVRLAWVVADTKDYKVTGQYCRLVKPQDGWVYEDSAIRAHNITPRYALHVGLPQERVIGALIGALEGVERVCAFNLDFHEKVLDHAAWECGLNWVDLFSEHTMSCAMRRSIEIVQKPSMRPGAGPRDYAWPKFTEAYEFFTGEDMPPLDMDPVMRGVALANCVRIIDQGINQYHQGVSHE